MAYGLRHACAVVAYCDLRPECRMCLQDNFRRGYLEDAPIYEDVRALPSDLPAFDVLCAGFPCKNISSMGDRRGLQGEHSGLLTDTLDVVEQHKPPYLMLENVSNICSMAGVWKYLLQRLHALGYDANWTTLSAADVGALHKRNRWFLLAKQRGVVPKKAGVPIPALVPTTETEYERMVPVDTLKARHRLTMLGNVCVPQQARTAWNFLMQWGDDCVWNRGAPWVEPSHRMPTCGAIRNGVISACKPPPKPFATRKAGVVLVPKDTGPTNQRLARRVTEPLLLSRWATPRACMGLAPSGHRTGIAKNLTVRSKNDLQTQVRFEQRTKDGFNRRLVSPMWLEKLMGLPPHFTHYSAI